MEKTNWLSNDGLWCYYADNNENLFVCQAELKEWFSIPKTAREVRFIFSKRQLDNMYEFGINKGRIVGVYYFRGKYSKIQIIYPMYEFNRLLSSNFYKGRKFVGLEYR